MIAWLRELLRRHPVSEVELTAVADERVTGAEAARLEAHLADCLSCREKLAELRSLKAMLAALPQASPARSFALPAEMAGAPVRRSGAASRSGLVLMPALALSALVLLLAVDFAVIDDGTESGGQSYLGSRAAEKAARDSGALAPAITAAGTEVPTPQAGAPAPSLADRSGSTPEAAGPAPPDQKVETPPAVSAEPSTRRERERSVVRVLEILAVVSLVGSSGYLVWSSKRGV